VAGIRIQNFGGLLPKLAARRLPENAAQVAENIFPDTIEFRPVATDFTVISSTGVSNPKTIYRLQRTAGGALNETVSSAATWKIHSGLRSYARTQLTGDLTERTVMSYDDGSAAPRMIDAQGGDRQLGVPAPSAAATPELVVEDEFTPEDLTAYKELVKSSIAEASYSVFTPLWKGAPRPGTGTTGYRDHDTQEPVQERVFRLSTSGGANTGTISNTYATPTADFYGWVFDSALWGHYVTATGSWPSWSGQTNDHWCVPYYAYGRTRTLDETALRTFLATLELPAQETPAELLTEEQKDEIVALVQAAVDEVDDAGQQKLDDLAHEVDALRNLFAGNGIAQQTGAVGGFYALSDVAATIDAALNNFARTAFNTARTAASWVDVDYSG
jgi:hypothetical protein